MTSYIPTETEPLVTYLPRIAWRITQQGNVCGDINGTTSPEMFFIRKHGENDRLQPPDPELPYHLTIMPGGGAAVVGKVHVLGWFIDADTAKQAALRHIERIDAGERFGS